MKELARHKAARLMAMDDVERAVYHSKRNQRSYWQHLDHTDWVKFCKEMSSWFDEQAPDEWDEYVIHNNERKAASDLAAVASKHGS